MERPATAPSRTPPRHSVSPQVMRIVVLYAALSTLWILFSDVVLEWLYSGHASEHAHYMLAQVLKGWIFVAVTTLLLYALIRRTVNELLAGLLREQALQTETQRMLDLLDGIVEGSSDAIYAKDADGRYILFNRSAARMVGKPVRAVLGQDDRVLFPADQAAAIMASDRRVMADDRPTTYREELDTTQGRTVLLTTKGPLHDAQGRVAGTFGITVDPIFLS